MINLAALQTITFTSSYTSNYYRLELEIDENSVSIENNTSSIAYRLYMKQGGRGYSFSNYRIGWSVSFNGSVVSSKAQSSASQKSLSENSRILITSGNATIPHDESGAKTMSFTAKTMMSKASYTPGDMSLSGNMVLTQIARASALDFGVFTIGTAGTIAINRLDNSYVDTITYSFAGTSGMLANKTSASTISWTPPDSFYALIPNSSALNGVMSVTSYDTNNSETGTRSFAFTVAVPDDVVPTVDSVTVTSLSDNTFIASKNIYVAGYSKAVVVAQATAGRGASGISSYNVTGDFGTATTASFTSDIIQTSGSKTANVTAVDSRGRKSAVYATGAISVLDYTLPKVTEYKYIRGTYNGGEWATSIRGNDLRITLTLDVSLVEHENTVDLRIQVDGYDVTTLSGQTSGDKVVYVNDVTADSAHTLSVVATDSVGNTVVQSLIITKLVVPLNINFESDAVCVGGVAEGRENFTCDFPAVFNGDVTVASGKTLYAQAATQQLAGLMSAADKTKLDALDSSSESSITVGNNGGYLIYIGDIQIETGEYQVTPSANTAKETSITFTAQFDSTPFVLNGAKTGNPHRVFAGSYSATSTGFKSVLYRSDASSTGMKWIAIGKRKGG